MQKTKFSFVSLTISDAGSKGEREDTSGDAIADLMTRAGFVQVDRRIVPDDADVVSAQLREWCDAALADVVVTTGGNRPGTEGRDAGGDA